MKAKLIFVSTLDGKITKANDAFVKRWASNEDRIYFENVWNSAPLIVIGSRSFDADPIEASNDHLLIVMTSRPQEYQSSVVKGQLEFSKASPSELFHKYEEEGYQDLLVAGGAHVATSFLKERLIDELWLTFEPKIFGQGLNFAMDKELDIDLELISSEKVNAQGTLINKYKVLK